MENVKSEKKGEGILGRQIVGKLSSRDISSVETSGCSVNSVTEICLYIAI